MRIVLLGTAVSGGIGRNLVNLSEALTAKGAEVHLILESMDGPLTPLIVSQTAVYPLSTTHPTIGALPLARRLLALKPDAVLAPNHRLALLAIRARTLIAPWHGVRVYANVHNTYSLQYLQLAPRKRQRRIHKLKRYYPRLDGIICVSEGTRNDFALLTGISKDRMAVIYNPVVTHGLLDLARQPLEHPWFRPGQPPVILGAGRLVPAKDFAGLMAAFELVRARLSCRLVIVGSGPLYQELEDRRRASRWAADIALVGNDNNPFRYMHRASLFVLSSRYEGFGNVLVEALACGAPVVATDCPHGPREVLMEGKLGPLVPVGDVDALAGAMAATLNCKPPDSLLRQSLARFSADNSANEYLKLFLAH